MLPLRFFSSDLRDLYKSLGQSHVSFLFFFIGNVGFQFSQKFDNLPRMFSCCLKLFFFFYLKTVLGYTIQCIEANLHFDFFYILNIVLSFVHYQCKSKIGPLYSYLAPCVSFVKACSKFPFQWNETVTDLRPSASVIGCKSFVSLRCVYPELLVSALFFFPARQSCQNRHVRRGIPRLDDNSNCLLARLHMCISHES